MGSVDKIPSISVIRQRLEKQFHTKINSCQINWYNGPKSSLNFHKDNEPSLDDTAHIFILSLGKSRDMCFKNNYASDSNNVESLQLSHNSMMVFSPDVQRKLLHSVSAGEQEDTEDANRFSLVFRCMKSMSSDVTASNSTSTLKSNPTPVTSFPSVEQPIISVPLLKTQPDTGTTHTLLIGSSMTRDFNQWRLSRQNSQVSVLSYSGCTFQKLITRLPTISKNLYVSSDKIGKIILFIGSNDVMSTKNIEHCFRDVDSMIESIKQLFPHAEISLISVPPKSGKYLNKSIVTRIYAMNKYFKYVCLRENLNFINIFWDFIHKDRFGNKVVKEELLRDGLHLSHWGVAIVCKRLKRVLYKSMI